MNRSKFLSNKFFYLLIPALFFISCAKQPVSIIYDPVEKEQQDEKLVQKVQSNKKAVGSINSNSVEVPSDYELGLQESMPLFSTLNPNVNDQRKKAYIKKLMRSLKNKPQRNRVKIQNHERIQYYLNRFQRRDRKNFAIWLKRSEKYIPTIQKILAKNKVPKDIAYLAMIESGFKMTARSHASAVGPWQFISSTGKRYDLKINSWVDHRMDLEKSTQAAADYLNDLYDMFQSWDLALAAYNCGEDRTFKAVRKNKSYDFWVISKDLPRETRNYVPKYYAALKIAKNPRKYGFKKPRYKTSNDYKLVKVPPQRSLKEIAKIAKIKPDTLYKYNPTLIGLATPRERNSYIKVPKNYLKRFESNEEQIFALEKMKKPSYRYSSYYYRVRRGDTLSTIARRHGTSVRNLKRHNSIRGSFIRAGQRLRIVKGSHRSTYVADSSNSSTYYYRVRRGDTLGTIARRHGTSVKNLKRHNGIRGSFIKAGQRLKIVNGSQKSITTASKGKYIVQRGDSLSVIAQRHKVSVRDLKVANNISGTRIKAGQVINIPSRGSASKAKVEHKIKRGDTLIKIAKAYSVSVSDIKKWNSLDSTKLIAGKNLVIFR